MFNPTQIVIEAFVRELQAAYLHTYSVLEPIYPDVIAFIGRAAMENIANSDAPYHNAEHTMMVTLVGQEILRGKHIREGGVSPPDWLHFISSLLCHDIGYVRGVYLSDGNGRYVCNEQGDLVEVADGATDASMTPYHVSRSKVFVRERFGKARVVQFDTLSIERYDAPSGEPVHIALLTAGVVILEGLDLARIAAGDYILIFLPLKLHEGDGGPGRAVLIEG
jgi:hypothetical protein